MGGDGPLLTVSWPQFSKTISHAARCEGSRTNRLASERGFRKTYLRERYHLVHPSFPFGRRVVHMKVSSIQVEGNFGALAAGQVQTCHVRRVKRE